MWKRKNKLFTFVLIRETEHPIRQFRLRTWQIQVFLTAAVALFLTMVVLSVLGLSRVDDTLRLRKLSEENNRLHRDILLVEEKADELEDVIRDVSKFQRWTRNLADLEPLSDDILAGGVGGPVTHRMDSEVAGVDRRLDRLGGRTQILRQSAEEVLSSLRDKKEVLSRIPSIRPILGGRVSSRFGRRVDPFTGRPAMHRGIDFAARRGTPIYATAEGRVKKIKRSNAGFGNELTIDHGNGILTHYAHCDRILASKGQKVTRGEVIATVGNSGRSTGPHLHYDIVQDGKAVNPSHFILSREFIVD
jgi:hypothetical protein